MLRYLNKSKVSDRIGTETILSKQNMLSVNQLNAQIKLTEVWKAKHDSNQPLKIEETVHDISTCLTRAVANGDLKEFGKSTILQSTF